MDFPLNKTKKELTLFLIEKSYEVYKQNSLVRKKKDEVIKSYITQSKQYEEIANVIGGKLGKSKENELYKKADDAYTGIEKAIEEKNKKEADLIQSFQPKKTDNLQEALEEVDRIKTLCSTVEGSTLQLACLSGVMSAFGQVEKITNNLTTPIEIPEPVKKSKEIIIKPIVDEKRRSSKKQFLLGKENFVDLIVTKMSEFGDIRNLPELFELQENFDLRNELTNHLLFEDKELFVLTVFLYSLNIELLFSLLNQVLKINSYYYFKEEKKENLLILNEIIIEETVILNLNEPRKFTSNYKPIFLIDNENNKKINLSILIADYIYYLIEKSDFKILREAHEIVKKSSNAEIIIKDPLK